MIYSKSVESLEGGKICNYLSFLLLIIDIYLVRGANQAQYSSSKQQHRLQAGTANVASP